MSDIRKNVMPRNPKPQDPGVKIGKSKEEPAPLEHWSKRYHTFDEIENAPPITFLIDGFLTENGVTALAAPVAQRKSLIAMNIVHSLLTGDKLFDHFAVKKQPKRVLYLCPEMGIQSFAQRLRDIGLMQCVGKTLFCQTMMSSPTQLPELVPEELEGSVIVLDTAIRFLQGDENKSDDMRKFAAEVFALLKQGALSVILLHHSAKGSKESPDLTLENCMRGSGELGAFVACCWATRLQDPKKPYTSASYLENVKQRDFASEPLEVVSDKTGKLTIHGTPGEGVTLRFGNNRGNKDGKDDAVDAIIKAALQKNPYHTPKSLAVVLDEADIKRHPTVIGKRLKAIKGTGVDTSEGPN